MANGILSGSGTQANPYIVEDGWDFDALRNLPATEWQWIELVDDINLAIFPNWIPIPSKRFNINGGGYTIKGLRIVGSAGSLGLFAQLETLETKDLRIEAEIIHTAAGTSDFVGILCGRLVGGSFGALSTDPPRTASILNIQCFGNITVTATASTQATGGCFGSTWGEANVTLQIVNCAYYGSISYHITSSSTTTPSAAQLRACGGIVGHAEARASIANYSITLANCISVTQFVMLGGTAHALVGGIMGATRTGAAPNITGCISKNRLLVTNILPWTQPIWFGGVLGAGMVSCTISMCAAHNEVIFNPSGSVAGMNIAGLHCMRSTGTNPVNASYAVINFTNPNNADLPVTRSMRGIGGQVVINNSFYDSQVLAEGWSEAVTNPEWGRTTAQLQSQTFLESQGWVFADV